MPIIQKIIPIRNDNRFADKIFIEDDMRSMGRMGKVTGIGYDCGEEVVTYSIFDTMGQLLSSRDSARIEDFNRYMQAGRLQWRA